MNKPHDEVMASLEPGDTLLGWWPETGMPNIVRTCIKCLRVVEKKDMVKSYCSEKSTNYWYCYSCVFGDDEEKNL